MSVDRTETRDLASTLPDRVTAMVTAHEQWEKDCAAGLAIVQK